MYVYSTIFLNIIVLNLLISIISDTYDKVTMSQQATDYKQKVGLLLEIERMMFWRRSKDIHGNLKTKSNPMFLHVLSYVDGSNAGSGGDAWEGKIRLIRKSVEVAVDSIKELSE